MGRNVKYLILVMVFAIVGLVMLSANYQNKYNAYKNAEQNAYILAVNSILNNGIEMPQFQTSKALELFNENSSEAKEGIETWLLEAATDISVAQKFAEIASIHLSMTQKENSGTYAGMPDFFGSIRTSLLDIVRTENDFEQWKQASTELNEIMKFLNENLDDAVVLHGDYDEVKEHWNQLMEQIHQKYPNSRLLKPYFSNWALN
ncbi:hypothetical protein SY83_03955 [Paenibacillus swuensis]|uniref:Uncharacterized protein n=1 Tax=Paenibacillus swuensis TaxID=1178515 RepID=A0A172TF62_9BACL|nr:hypothetical protein SY83_03955 [Paenibacillus swuensis]